ncbi:hypothetical protein EDB87DRAFT_281980 [Lactarius vividus]|nr:hypothetical protein EDB87DRAFT_281980 [Lactarius vividus]
MSHFNAPFGIPNPDTFLLLDVPASVEDDSTDINSTFDFSFLYDGGTSPYNITGFESKGSSSTAVTTGEFSANGAFGGLATIDTTTLASAPAPPPLANYGASPHLRDFGPLSELIDCDFPASPTPSLSNASSNPSPPKNGIGDWINSPHVREALASTFASLPDLLSEPGIPSSFQEEGLTLAPSYGGGIGSTPQTQWDDGAAFTPAGMFENMSCVHFPTLALFPREIIMLVFAGTCLC